jgi:hypothetical protein
VEDDDQVKARKLLEEKLSAALIRRCPACAKQVVKEDGCNLMRCVCGSKFCYVCRANIDRDGYSHFTDGRRG